MKPRHYPLLTVSAAAAVTLLPVAIFFAVVRGGSGDVPVDLLADADMAFGTPEIPEASPSEDKVARSAATQSETSAADREPVTAEDLGERVAVTEPVEAQSTPDQETRPAPPEQHPTDNEPPPEAPTFLSAILGALAEPSAAAASKTMSGGPALAADPPNITPAESNHFNDLVDSAVPDPRDEPAVRVDSPYEATRHPAMMSHPLGAAATHSPLGDAAAGSDRPGADASTSDDETSTTAGASDRHSRRTSANRDRSRGSPRNSNSDRAKKSPDHPPQEETGITYEPVVLQTLREDRPVNRVENLVARGSGRGWPIALVRSDLPDDVWWVQQMVGSQGNAFAARVNFGNEHTFSGSPFRLVIVFLDTADEVRRFRIAKQFKEIPEGIRRSREFTFVRR